MGARQFVVVGLRLFAVWLCVSALQFYALMSALKRMTVDWGNSAWMGILVVGVCAAVALLVWVLSGAIARALTLGVAKTVETRLSAFDVVAVGCILMGLWWLKASVVPLVTLWMRAAASSTEAGQSAFVWLGVEGKTVAIGYLLEIGIGLFFICRPYDIAKWVLRHSPAAIAVDARPPERFDVLLRRATELGLRQSVRPDIVTNLTEQIASHPDVLRRFLELEELLRYKANPFTRSAAARAIVLTGPAAAARARDLAITQLVEEEDPEVVKSLRRLVELASQGGLADSGELFGFSGEEGNA